MSTDYSNLAFMLFGGLAITLAFMLYRYQSDNKRLKRAEAAAQRQAQELAALNQIRIALAEESELPALFQSVVETTARTFGYPRASLYLLDGSVLILQSAVGYSSPVVRIPVSQGVSGRIVKTGQPELIADVRQEAAFLGPTEGIESCLSIPLFDQDRVVGTLNVESARGHVLSEADLRLMMMMGDQLKIAIGRSRIYTEARENEQKYRSIIDNVKEVIFRTDADGYWAFLNPAWTALTGFEIGKTLRTTVLKYIKPEDHRRFLIAFSPIISGKKEKCQVELRIVTADGGDLWIEMNAYPGRNEEVLVGVFGTILDISERKRREEEQFRLSKLEVDGPLTGSVADDFNHLLTGILGNISFIRQLLPHDADKRLSHRLVEAEKEAIQAKSLIQQMLTFATGHAPDLTSPGLAEASPGQSGHKKILLMDDERIVRSLVSDILTHSGYKVQVTEDGADAVQAYVQELEAGAPFDVVIMDLTVPGGMGGHEALQHILMKDPYARVVVSSGYANDPALANYRQYGFMGMVSKPYQAEELTKVLNEVLTAEGK